MNHSGIANLINIKNNKSSRRLLCATLVLVAAAGLSGCGNGKEKKSGQALASVNGEEITAMQLNEEMQRAGVQAAQQETAKKQLLEALIDRQLLLNEAARDKTDRDPAVVQAIERAKALIIAQSVMQKRLSNVAKPTKAEVEDYFQKHPEFFTRRKQLDMRQLVIASKDMDEPLKKAMDASKSLEEMAAWLDGHNLKYARNQISRTTADLTPELGAKLLAMPKGQLFIIKEGERSMLIAIADVKDVPVNLETAGPQIEQFLMNAKNKEAASAELARLRAAAKVDYLNQAAVEEKKAAPAAAKPAVTSSESNDRGVAGLK